MIRDKRTLAETLRKYKKHILGSLFLEAADTIDALLDENEELKAKIGQTNDRGEERKE